MIQSIWDRKVFAIIQLSSEDVCDENEPLPLFLSLSWNHYMGFYYREIMDFFLSYAPFPFRNEEFALKIISISGDGSKNQQEVSKSEIVYHMMEKYLLNFEEPIQMKCEFRRQQKQVCQIDLPRHFKNNLKASTALRYGKYGAAKLTVEMSINNVSDMFQSFSQNDLQKYQGSRDPESDDLGFIFLIEKGQRVPLRIIGKDFLIERAGQKLATLESFLMSLFGEDILKGLQIRLHGVKIQSYEPKFIELEKYCHPDGFLYFHI